MFTVKVAPIKEKDKADVEWNCISLTVTAGATIDSHLGKLAVFGLDREVGMLLLPLDVSLRLTACCLSACGYTREAPGHHTAMLLDSTAS